MSNTYEIKLSRFLSLVLRHKPEAAKIIIKENGWTNTKVLIDNINKFTKYHITMELLEKIVKEDDKGRYSFNTDKSQIRANQGHSIDVNMQFDEIVPPEFLYHGTADKYIYNITKEGIIKRTRNFVHLSKDLDTAMKVGSRHGECRVLTIRALDMYKDGYKFFISENGVYLVEHIPVKYIKFKTL